MKPKIFRLQGPMQFNTASTGSILDDIGDFVTDPSNIIRAVSYMGWVGYLASFLPGILSTAAEVTVNTLPGLVRGESFSDAFVAEYSWRLSNVAKYIGNDKADKAITKELPKYTNDPELKQRVNDALKAARAANPNISPTAALEAVGLSPKDLVERCLRQFQSPNPEERALQCREDTIALALNVLAHENIYDTRLFDPITGKVVPRDLLVPFVENLKANSKPATRPVTSVPGKVAVGPNIQPPPPMAPGQLVPIPVTSRAPTVPMGSSPFNTGTGFVSSSDRGILGQLLTLAALTSPVWFPVYVWPKLKKRFL